MAAKIEKDPNGTITLSITIPWKSVEGKYQAALVRLGREVELKGFRKGKAPLKLLEKSIKKSTVYEEILKDLIPEVYIEAVKEHNLKPIVNPQVKVVSLEEGKDWEIQAMLTEFPEVDLGDYKKLIDAELASDKIWVPGKDDKVEDKEKAEDEKLQKIFGVLLKNTKVTIPEMLVSEEVNRMLSRLIEQTEKLGLTVEQYLTSIGKTSEQLKEEYGKQSEETLKLELILSKIADQELVKVSDEEVNQMVDAAPDEATKKALVGQTGYIKQILRKRKVIESLMA